MLPIMNINFDMDIELTVDLQILILRICIKTDDLYNFQKHLDFYELRPDVYGNYFIRYAKKHKAIKIIKYLASLKEVQNFWNMNEIEVLNMCFKD